MSAAREIALGLDPSVADAIISQDPADQAWLAPRVCQMLIARNLLAVDEIEGGFRLTTLGEAVRRELAA